uniref:Uncharacterized protein n=1 Tax=Salix viminalis TaxID=40686 RepID=A0A6N2MJS9_SALVM
MDGPKEKNFSSIETLRYGCCTSFSTKKCYHSTPPPSISYMYLKKMKKRDKEIKKEERKEIKKYQSLMKEIMERNRLGLRIHHSGSSQSEESALDLERNYCNHLPWSSLSQLQPFASGGQHSESNAAYFSWPTLSRLNDAAEDRANYFGNLQKGLLPETLGRSPTGQQATTLLELMTIRAFHSKILRRFSLGTAIGFRIQRGILTDIPAILVSVARKVHRQWLSHVQCLPEALEEVKLPFHCMGQGPGGVWCDVDVVEFSYYGAPAATPKEQLYAELVDGLRGSDPSIGPGSQGTLGAIVKSRTGNRQVGFLTNRHVAVDLDYPNQKMFHPLLWYGIFAVERATSFITDELWYGIFAGTNPENWSSGVDLDRLLDDLKPDLITTSEGLQEVKLPFHCMGQGPGGVWCDVDVVEFSYYGAPAATPKEQLYTELVDGLRGSDPSIGPGSQLQFKIKEMHWHQE